VQFPEQICFSRVRSVKNLVPRPQICAAGRADIHIFLKHIFTYNICCCGGESSHGPCICIDGEIAGERISKSVALAECLALHLIFWRCRKSARAEVKLLAETFIRSRAVS